MASPSLDRRLATEQQNHAEAFSTLARSFDRIAGDLAIERERRVLVENALFRTKSRLWFAGRRAG